MKTKFTKTPSHAKRGLSKSPSKSKPKCPKAPPTPPSAPSLKTPAPSNSQPTPSKRSGWDFSHGQQYHSISSPEAAQSLRLSTLPRDRREGRRPHVRKRRHS